MHTKQETKFTPGPWEVRPGIANSLAIVADSPAIPGKVRIVAEISRNCWDKNDRESNSNAKLIASAPELLAAAKRYIVAVDAYYRQNPSAETVGEKCVDLILAEESLQSAILSATT